MVDQNRLGNNNSASTLQAQLQLAQTTQSLQKSASRSNLKPLVSIESRPDLVENWGIDHMDLVVRQQNLLSRFRRKQHDDDCVQFVEIFDKLDTLLPIQDEDASDDEEDADENTNG